MKFHVPAPPPPNDIINVNSHDSNTPSLLCSTLVKTEAQSRLDRSLPSEKVASRSLHYQDLEVSSRPLTGFNTFQNVFNTLASDGGFWYKSRSTIWPFRKAALTSKDKMSHLNAAIMPSIIRRHSLFTVGESDCTFSGSSNPRATYLASTFPSALIVITHLHVKYCWPSSLTGVKTSKFSHFLNSLSLASVPWSVILVFIISSWFTYSQWDTGERSIEEPSPSTCSVFLQSLY